MGTVRRSESVRWHIGDFPKVMQLVDCSQDLNLGPSEPKHKILARLSEDLLQSGVWVSEHSSNTLLWLSLAPTLAALWPGFLLFCWRSWFIYVPKGTFFCLQWIVGSDVLFIHCNSIWFISSEIHHQICSVGYTHPEMQQQSFADFNSSLIIQWHLETELNTKAKTTKFPCLGASCVPPMRFSNSKVGWAHSSALCISLHTCVVCVYLLQIFYSSCSYLSTSSRVLYNFLCLSCSRTCCF